MKIEKKIRFQGNHGKGYRRRIRNFSTSKRDTVFMSFTALFPVILFTTLICAGPIGAVGDCQIMEELLPGIYVKITWFSSAAENSMQRLFENDY
jgi:hypothetical protein